MPASYDLAPVVFDIGVEFTKAGFAGDNSPRCIIRSEVLSHDSNQIITYKYCRADKDLLYDFFRNFLRYIYNTRLLVTSRDRRVVIVESVLCPSLIRETLAEVFFKCFEVPSLMYFPSHLMAASALGLSNALVIDAGYSEVQIFPLYEGMVLLSSYETLQVGAKSIHDFIESQLVEDGKVMSGKGEIMPLASNTELITSSLIEDIKVRACFVSPKFRAQKLVKNDKSCTPAPPLEYPLGKDKILLVPGLCRELAAESIFQLDYDDCSLQAMVLNSILKCPIDCRKELLRNIILIGGTVCIPGFESRFVDELKSLIDSDHYKEKFQGNKQVRLHKLSAPPNCQAWLGASIMSSPQIQFAVKPLTKAQYRKRPRLLDWFNLM